MQQQLFHQMQLQQQQQQNHPVAFNTTSITTDHIQQYLDENKALILNILENQNTGKFSECAENQTRLQHNLMYLAAIADCQPKQSPIHLQPYMNPIQQQQLQTQQQMVPQSQIMAQSQSPFMLQSHLGVGGPHTPQSGPGLEGQSSRAFPDFGQLVFGESSVSRPTSGLKFKENRSNNSVDCGENPQKKGKLNRSVN